MAILIESYPVILVAVLFSVLLSYFLFASMLVKIKKMHDAQVQRLESTVSVLTSGSLGMGQKMLSLEKKLSKLRDTQDEMKSSDLDFSYTQAQKLIAQGMDSRAIAANSGLTSTEINLMRMLHQQQSESAHV